MPPPIGPNFPQPVLPTNAFGNANAVGPVDATGPGSVGNAGGAPQNDIALPQQAKTTSKASDVAKELDVLFAKAASSSVGSLDAAALEKAIAAVTMRSSMRRSCMTRTRSTRWSSGRRKMSRTGSTARRRSSPRHSGTESRRAIRMRRRIG